jgi:hypothetical protein
VDSQLLDFVVLALYFAVMIGAGYWGLRRARSADGLAAVVLGGASTIGGVALGYDYGISGMWLVFWIGMGVIALGILMSSRVTTLLVGIVVLVISLIVSDVVGALTVAYPVRRVWIISLGEIWVIGFRTPNRRSEFASGALAS